MYIVNKYLHYSEQEDRWYWTDKPPAHAKLVTGYIIPLFDGIRRDTHFRFGGCVPNTLWYFNKRGCPQVL